MLFSCGRVIPEVERMEKNQGTRTVELTARMGAGSKAVVSTSGAVSWADGDKLGVYTSADAIRTFNIKGHSGAVATFAAELQDGENPIEIAVFPKSAFKYYIAGTATISYPSSYNYSEGAMLSPMAAESHNGNLAFAHLGGLISVDCNDVPAEAASFRITAPGRKITGDFYISPGQEMAATSRPSDSDNTATVSFSPGTTTRRFNVPVPAGSYPTITAGFYDAAGQLIYDWTLLEGVSIAAGDMFLREPTFAEINGTKISAASTRIGLITDSTTGAGIPGVPVTDGYSYTTTDANGVYQFVAHENARCVYPSVPAAYDVPLGADGEPHFWKTGSYRNDWTLTPRAEAWDDFTIVSFSDVHFWNKGASQKEEVNMYNSRTLPDLNAYIATLDDKLILFNTGDLVTNVSQKLAAAKAEFAKIKKNGVTVPMFPTIGNHDFNNSYTSTLECTSDWFEVFGPLDYSINVGKAHIVSMNNIQYAGNNSGGYGKSIQYTKGLTDEQWEWLQADLATVAAKSTTMLILCVHAPVTNHDDQHAEDIRNLLKTFAESHIFSGHSHYNAHRQYADGKNSMYTGRLAEEHNQPPLGGVWRAGLANDGAPNAYHVYKISGNTIESQIYKAIGSEDASLQMRLYDGNASYHAPATDSYNGNEDIPGSGKLYFDWDTVWQNSEGFSTKGKLIARVFDAGTRGINVKVYCNTGGVRTPMTPCSKTHRDQCAYSFFINGGSLNGSMSATWAQAYYQVKSYGFWYCDMPSGDDWKVEVEFTEPSGTRHYESSTIQKDYSGFAW